MIQAASGESKTSEDDDAPESELAQPHRRKLRLSSVDFHDVLIAEHMFRANALPGEFASGPPNA